MAAARPCIEVAAGVQFGDVCWSPKLSRRFVPATGFDILLPWYDWLVEPCTNERRMKNRVADEIASGDMSSVLDVGCGTGTLLKMLAECSRKRRTAGARDELVGVDIDPRMLRRAAMKLHRHEAGETRRSQAPVKWIEGDACKLPFSSDRYSTVVTTLTLHHLQDAEKRLAIAECLRVLKPGGRLLLADFAQPANRLAGLQFLAVRMCDGFDRTKAHLGGGLADLIRQSGCEDLGEVFAMPSPLGTIRCYRAGKAGEP